jgi:hypothetical protein
LHNEELHNSYPPSNIFRVVTSRKMRWGSLSTHREVRNPYKILVGGHSEELDADGRIILDWK